jgi:hypothetical protein
MSDEERVVLTVEQAVAMLPDGDSIHTFLDGVALIGADWSREEILEGFNTAESIELAGPTATSMGHGLVFLDNRGIWVFVETKKVEAK